MKIIIALLLLTLTACSIRDCKLDPALQISQSSERKDSTATAQNSNTDNIRAIARDATKGGQLSCRF